MGNRLFLDSCSRFGSLNCDLHSCWRNEVSTLHISASDSYLIAWFAHHTCVGLTRLGAGIYYSNVSHTSDSMFKTVFYDKNWLFFCGWMFLFCIIVIVVVSLLTEAPSPEKIQGLVIGTETKEQRAASRASWNHWDVIHSVIILGITVAFYIYFW